MYVRSVVISRQNESNTAVPEAMDGPSIPMLEVVVVVRRSAYPLGRFRCKCPCLDLKSFSLGCWNADARCRRYEEDNQTDQLSALSRNESESDARCSAEDQKAKRGCVTA